MPEVVEVDKELAGTYNPALLLDNSVKMRVRALTFQPNLNNFMFKKEVLAMEHSTAFGAAIPAYKSFIGAPVNRDHIMRDNNKGDDYVIGFVENAELMDDGVYLDLVLWKRILSDRELSQIRNNKVSVSMETEYTAPVLQYPSGKEVSYTPGTPIPSGAVRTMSSKSTVSFVGIAVLFDGKAPADPKSKVIFAENAALTESITSEITQIDSIVLPNNEGASMSKELEELQAEIAALKAAKEQSDASVQELHAMVQAKTSELDEAQAKLSNTYTELETKSAELMALKKQAFMANIEVFFNLEGMKDGPKAFLMQLFDWYCYGCTDPMKFEDVAENLIAIGAAAKPGVADTDDSAEGETSSVADEEQSTPENTDTAEPETHTEQEIAGENENTEEETTVTTETSTEETPAGDTTTVVAEGTVAGSTVPPAVVEAANISGKSNSGDWSFDPKLL